MDDGGLLSYNKDYVRKGLVFNTQGFTLQFLRSKNRSVNPLPKFKQNIQLFLLRKNVILG